MAAVPISRPRRGGGVRPWPAAWLSVSQTHGRVGRLGCCLGQTARGSWRGSGWRRNRWRRRGSRHGTIFISTPGRAAKCHKKMETQVIVIVLFLTYPPQPAASSTHPHSEKINKTCLLNTSEIALFMARGRRREVGGGVEVKQEVRTAEAVTGSTDDGVPHSARLCLTKIPLSAPRSSS